MVREPTWQGPGETNWSLPAYRWRTAFRSSVMAIPGIINDVRLAASQHRTARTLRQGSGIKLALGSGSTAPQGWYGLDLFRCGTRVMRANLLLGIPAADGTVSAVLAEHFLEHLYLDDAGRMLAECRRVMLSGAVIRIVSPDALTVAQLLRLGTAAEDDPMVAADVRMHRWPQDGLNWARTINRISHQWGQHRSLLTAEVTSLLLESAGFVGVVSMDSDRSEYFADGPPDVHPLRFPDEIPGVNFAVEARTP